MQNEENNITIVNDIRDAFFNQRLRDVRFIPPDKNQLHNGNSNNRMRGLQLHDLQCDQGYSRFRKHVNIQFKDLPVQFHRGQRRLHNKTLRRYNKRGICQRGN